MDGGEEKKKGENLIDRVMTKKKLFQPRDEAPTFRQQPNLAAEQCGDGHAEGKINKYRSIQV